MRITIVTPIYPPEIGGPASYTSKLGEKLMESGHSVKIVAFSKKSGTKTNLTRVSTKGNTLTRQFRLWWAVVKQSLRSDIIYTQGTLVVGMASLLATRLLRKKLILKFVGDEVWELAQRKGDTHSRLESFYQNPPGYTRWIKLHRYILNKCDAVITPSLYLKRFLVKYHRVDPKKIKVITNAVELPDIDMTKTPDSLIFVGRLVPWKNVDQIIKAVQLARRVKKWHLTIVGSGPQKRKLQKLVSNLKAQNWVTFTDRLPQKKAEAAIARSEKLILYSSYEGQSHTLITALNTQTIVITSNILPNKELVNQFGILVKLNSQSQLAQAINEGSVDVIKAAAYAKEKFSWESHLYHLNKLISHV